MSAKLIFNEFVEAGHRPNEMHLIQSRPILLDACVKTGDFVSAKLIFSEFVEAGHQPNAVHYTAIVKCFLNEGRIEEAEGMI